MARRTQEQKEAGLCKASLHVWTDGQRQCKPCMAERKARWDTKNSDYRTDYTRSRSQNDPKFRLTRNLRRRLNHALMNNQKTGSAVSDLGCSIDEFKLYIENQFDEMMTWDNYGKVWELDHVIPLNQFDLSDRMEFLEACNWLNIRPMFCIENKSRSKIMLGM